MPVRSQEAQTVQAAISVSEMARRLTLSRGRFYELIRAGILPSPCYCPFTRRALYSIELQQQCLTVRETNIGLNGQYILFYRARAAASSPSMPSRRRRGRNGQGGNTADSAVAQLREGLAALGLAAMTDEQIHAAVNSAFPAGTNGIDPGTVLAAVFRLLRCPNAARLPPAS